MFKNLLDDFDEKSAPEINLLEGYEEEPETGKSALGALGKTISRVPENLLASGITAIQGVKGASVTDQGIGDKIVNWVDERNKALSREYEGTGDVIPGLISKQDIAELGPNLAFSGVSMGATVAGGAAGAATPIPGGAIAGGLAGGGIAAHRMQSYQAMNSWLKKQNKESIEKFGRPISPEEEAVFKEKFSALASESGLWEAGPEAIGNVLELALITAKKKIPGVNLVPDTVMKKIASGALRVGGLLATELGTESVTQMGQQRVGVEAGEAPEGEVKREWTSGDDWLKSAREVLPQVLLLTGVMGAGGAAYRRATSANDQLSKDIDAQMGELAEESQAVNEGVPGTGIDIAESAKELGGKSGGELGKEEAGARKEERREGSPFKPAKPFVPGMDRRKDPETRKRVADMSPEERSQALLTDTLTGLSNKRAYEERERLSVQSSIDVDGLKYVNDTFGHEAGNQLLKKVGDAIRQAAGENPSYHFHGDEFVLEGNSPEEISDIVSRARDILAKEPLSFEKDGKKTSYTAGFSYGTAGTLDAADQEMLKDKAQRKIIRGELPPGTDNQKFDPEGNILRTYTKSKFPEADALFDLFPETAKAQIVPPSLFRGILVNRYVSPLMESETPQFRIQQLEELEALNKDLDIGNLRHDSIASIDAAINMRKIDEKMGQVLKEVASLVKSPDFHIAIKEDVNYEGAYNVFDNVIELKSPVAFAHEIGHWGFFNILSGKDRIEFMEKMVEKFGRGEKEKLAPQLAIPPTARSESGRMFQSNGADNFAEYFAEQFRQYLHSNRLTDTQHETLFKKVLGFLKTIYQRLRDKNIIDVDVVPFIEKILNPVIDIGAEKTTSQSAEEPTISELEAELDRWKKYTKDIPKSLSFKELGRRSDEVQKLIDDRHDKLDAEGIEWEKQQKDPELSELYAKRIAYDTVAAQKGYDGAKQIVEDNLRGIPKDSTYASVDSILREHYGLVDAPQTGVFMMAKYTGEALENPATIKQVGHNITQLIAERDYPNVDFWTLFESSNSVLTQKGKERYVQEGIAIAKKINIELRKFFTEESGNVLLPSKIEERAPSFSETREILKSEIGELTDALAGVKKRKETFSPGVDLAGIGDRSIKKSISTFEKVKEISKGVWDTWQKFQTAKEPEWTQYDNIMGEYEAETVKADHEGYKFAKQILALVPRRYQEAMTNYIEAGGDSKTLLTRAGKTKDGKLAEGYRTAANLPPDIKVYAEEVRGFFDSWLTRLQEADVLGDSFIRDYVNHVWGEDSKIGKEINAQADMGMFKTNPALARKRIIESYFEGEQLGLVPRDKGIGFLVATYAKAASEAINARTAVKQLFKGKAKDGLAILVPDKATAKPISKTEYTVVNPKLESGRAQRVFETEQEAANYIAKAKNKDLQLVPREKKILLVKQKFGNPITEDGRAYRPAPSHQALKKITWVGTDTAGNPVLYEGSALVHPDHYDNFSKAMGTSQIKKSPFGMTILRGTSFAKQTLLSASFFHPVQLAVHAIGHNVNILKMKAVNLNDPVQLNAVKHGLRMEFGHGLQQFNEGLWGGGLVEKIPIIGDFSRKLGEYTFKDLLPRFKMNMYEEALKRNTKRYGKTLTADQIMSKTADEANAAFGELNYRKLGRSKTMQDVLRLLTLAPDFLEARVRFTAQAFTKGHLEQMAAIGRLSAEIFILSRIINMLANDGDPKWEKPFGFVIGKHESTLRSVPGDILHAIKDPRNFIYHRLNPTLTRTTIEYLTGRDQFGKERDVTGQIRDFFVTHIPIPIQGPFRPGRDVEWWESAISSMGLSTYKDKSEAEKLMSKLISKNVPAKQLEKEEADLINAKAKLKDAIRNKGTIDPEVRKELAKLSPEQLRRVVRDANKYTQFGEKVNSGRLDLIDTLQVYKRTLYPWSDPKERMLSANALAKKYINAARNTPYKIASLSKGEREDIRRALSKEGMESDILGAIGSWY